MKISVSYSLLRKDMFKGMDKTIERMGDYNHHGKENKIKMSGLEFRTVRATSELTQVFS